MNRNILITRAKPLLETGVDDELFALDVDGGSCFSFNATAKEIWQMLETPMTLDSLCKRLMDIYQVDEATCVADTISMIEGLASDKLIILSPQ
jgi:Coenzyme PQQ synthesis protein D (PqqD)